ncbi:peroxide stress protein YaaA [Marinilabiliaceae bacterium JC017]|nr:peroxide stress protein YaaA [Marinilabiliaceae bacterium JC017]
MHILISPAKTLDFETSVSINSSSDIRFPQQSEALISILKNQSPTQLSKLMKISQPLAELNFHRFRNWHYPFNQQQTKPALFAFKGDVYTGIDARSMDTKTVEYTQEHLRILSGLYGILRPLDAILPYRLEMGTKLKNQEGNTLYKFWGNRLSNCLRDDMAAAKSQVLINLASNEYFKSINKKELGVRIVTPIFKDLKNDQYKVISFYAKKARGRMTRFILENRIDNAEELMAFDLDGYYYNSALSKKDQPVFTRDH